MKLLLAIARAHLLGRKRQSAVSLMGVAMGVGFFIALASLMQGFQRYFITTVVDVQPHITIKDDFRDPPIQPLEQLYPNATVALSGLKPRDDRRGIRHAGQVLERLSATPGLLAAPSLTSQVFLRYGSVEETVSLTGIDPLLEKRVSQIEDDIFEGSLDALMTDANGLILGAGVAKKLGVSLGDRVFAASPAGLGKSLTVVGLFRTGIVQYDNGMGYALLKRVQALTDRPDSINQVRLRLKDPEIAREVAAKLETRFGYRSENWQEANEGIFSVFVIQNIVMYSTVGAILIVAAFGIYNIISTVVYEKARDIAILRSMGFTERDVRRVFLMEGLIVGTIGGILGWGVGWGLTEALASIRIKMGGMIEADGLFLYRSFTHYAFGAAFSIVAATVAALAPARKAARMDPVQIIRGTG